jgi:hypothetical protein
MNLRITYIVFLGILLVFAACRQNNPVTLQDEIARDEPVEVLFLKEQPDTSSSSSVKDQTETTVDLTGLLRRDEQNYPGTILIGGVKSDLEGGRSSLSYSRILLRDLQDTVWAKGGWGYFSDYRLIDVGRATLDDVEFDATEIVTQLRTPNFVVALSVGVIQKLGNDGNQPASPMLYVPRHTYFISARGKRYGKNSEHELKSFQLPVLSPDEVTITSLQANSIVFRDEDLILRWRGVPGQRMKVIISTYDEQNRRAETPLVQFTAYPKHEALTISSKLLKLIPTPNGGKVLLSLVSVNQTEIALQGYPNKVLLQAASIHNVVVALR